MLPAIEEYALCNRHVKKFAQNLCNFMRRSLEHLDSNIIISTAWHHWKFLCSCIDVMRLNGIEWELTLTRWVICAGYLVKRCSYIIDGIDVMFVNGYSWLKRCIKCWWRQWESAKLSFAITIAVLQIFPILLAVWMKPCRKEQSFSISDLLVANIT